MAMYLYTFSLCNVAFVMDVAHAFPMTPNLAKNREDMRHPQIYTKSINDDPIIEEENVIVLKIKHRRAVYEKSRFGSLLKKMTNDQLADCCPQSLVFSVFQLIF